MEAVIARCCGSPSVVRHLRQTSSLLAHMQDANLLDTATNSTCYVEFGAGRGEVGFPIGVVWVCLARNVFVVAKTIIVTQDEATCVTKDQRCLSLCMYFTTVGQCGGVIIYLCPLSSLHTVVFAFFHPLSLKHSVLASLAFVSHPQHILYSFVLCHVILSHSP